VVDALDAIGLSPKGACGDVVRNVTGCPLAGVAADELIDASPLAEEIANLLKGNPEFYNLPRKFKISVTGCPSWCSYPEINDIGLTAVKHNGEVGYSLRVGGGLSPSRISPFASTPSSCRIRPFLWFAPLQRFFATSRACAKAVTAPASSISSSKRAGLRRAFWPSSNHGSTFTLLPGVPEQIPDDDFRDHAGIHPQRQPGLSYVGASVLRGRLTGEQLEAAAESGRALRQRLPANHRLPESAVHRYSQQQDRRTGS
jgi:sulfite reductase (ferredoxin)